MNDYLRDMALFVEIAQAGTFSKAATATGVPISTLSRRLSEFEKRLGFQLIKRSTRKLELTELGAQYFSECERLVAEASAALSWRVTGAVFQELRSHPSVAGVRIETRPLELKPETRWARR